MTFIHKASTQVLPALLENCRSGQRYGTSKWARLHWVTWAPMSSTIHSPLSLQVELFKYLNICSAFIWQKSHSLGRKGTESLPILTALAVQPSLWSQDRFCTDPDVQGPLSKTKAFWLLDQPLQGARWVRNPFLVHGREDKFSAPNCLSTYNSRKYTYVSSHCLKYFSAQAKL